jgi:DNA-binding transcriptional LysR family regulator
MDVRHLRAFVTIAEEMHLTRAAERLHVAQPHLTRLLHHLEEELGFCLLDRSNKRQLALTPAGETFLARITSILKQYEEAVQVARRVAQGEGGKLVVGYTAPAMFTGILPALLHVYQDNPEVELLPRDISSLSRQTILNMLLESRLDVAFVPTATEEPGLARELVYTDSLVVALPANHPLANQPALSLSELSQEAWIQPPRSLNPRWNDDVSALFQQAGFEPRVVQLTPQAHTTISQVAAGIGLTILGTWTQQNVPHQGVVFLPLQGSDYTLELHALWRKEDRSPMLQTFLQILQEVKDTRGQTSGQG